MSEYHVPRQPTTRVEFLPGLGLPEMGAVLLGAGIGYLLYSLVRMVGDIPGAWFLNALLPVAAFMLIQGGQNSLLHFLIRLRRFLNAPRRLLFQLGTGMQSAASAPETGRRSPAFLPLLLSLISGKKPQPASQSALPKSVQDWLPVQDVSNGLLLRRDGNLVAAVEVEAINFGLKSQNEQRNIIAALHEAVNALQCPAQILSVPRPLDLDLYVRLVDARIREVDPARQRLLRPYIRYVTSLIASGEVQERRYYILLPQPAGKHTEHEVRQRANDLAIRLQQAGVHAAVLDDHDIVNLLHVWSHPAQAAFEPAPDGPPSVTTLMEV